MNTLNATPVQQPAFSQNEGRRRAALVRAELDQRGLDGIFVTDPSNLVWLSGLEADSAYVEQSLFVSVKREEPFLCVREMDMPAALHQSFLSGNSVFAFPEELIADPEGRGGYDLMLERMRDEGILGEKLGIEFGSISHSAARRIQTVTTNSEMADVDGLIDRLRLIKSDEELQVMATAGRVTDAAMQAAIDAIEVGAREAEAVAAASVILVRGVGNDRPTQLKQPAFNTTPLTGTSHISWSDRVYRSGDQINIELGALHHRYAVGLMRTAHIGRAPDRLSRCHAAEKEALVQGLAAARTGNTCADVAKVASTVLADAGFAKKSRCGYGIGINWTEKAVSLREGDETVLETGMTFHLMLGNWPDFEFGYSFSETFVVGEEGGQTLSSLPRDLFQKSLRKP